MKTKIQEHIINRTIIIFEVSLEDVTASNKKKSKNIWWAKCAACQAMRESGHSREDIATVMHIKYRTMDSYFVRHRKELHTWEYKKRFNELMETVPVDNEMARISIYVPKKLNSDLIKKTKENATNVHKVFKTFATMYTEGLINV